MKVLFIGPYLQQDGWGRASYHFIKSLENKCDLSVRNIFLSNNIEHRLKVDPFSHLKKIEIGYDAVIQQVLPNLVTYNSRCGLNCVLPCVETIHDINDSWMKKIKLMDRVLTYSDFERNNAGWPQKKAFTIGGALDIEVYKREYNRIPSLKNAYNFYFIGENVERKSLATLIKCYLTEFSYKDNVNLVIKSDTETNINNLVTNIQKGLRKYLNTSMYATVKHVEGFVEDEVIYELHNSCDCFVMPSFGESFCIPMADALGFGNSIIINKNAGMSQFVDNDNAWLIDSKKESVFCDSPPMIDLYTVREKWFKIDEDQLQLAMRRAYEGVTKNKNRQELINKLSYDHVGNRIIECLH